MCGHKGDYMYKRHDSAVDLMTRSLPYISKPMVWGDACTEVMSGRISQWDCSYFMIRMIRDLCCDQSFGRGAPSKYIIAADQFRFLTESRRPLIGTSWPIIGVANRSANPSAHWNVGHIGFLLTQPRFVRTGELIPDYKEWIVLDMCQSIGFVNNPVRIHDIGLWFGAGTGAIPVWRPGDGDAQPAPNVSIILGQYLTGRLIAEATDGFITADRNVVRPIP